MSKRAFLIVLDSCGIGEEPDADLFGDVGTNTLKSCSTSKFFDMPNLKKMGLFNIDGVTDWAKDDYKIPSGFVAAPVANPAASVARLRERSMGKDTTIGHWEIAGIYSANPLPTYPNGFPQDLLDEFSKLVGRGVICNKTYSGTEVIKDYGDEHVKTGNLIVYTSADSVFQIAAHEDIVPLEELYDICKKARALLRGKHGVGRVIARPFVGTSGNYTRTSHRHDFSLEPPKETMLDNLKSAGKDVIAVGKINDIFVGQGITEFTYTSGNEEGIEKTLEYLDKDFDGLCFINLVDYDMLYGHRRDIDGYAKALNYFDSKLPEIIAKMKDDDVLMITADHGCDPGYLKTTDHTREYIPLIMYSKSIAPKNYGTRTTFSDIGSTVLDYLGVKGNIEGVSLLS